MSETETETAGEILKPILHSHVSVEKLPKDPRKIRKGESKKRIPVEKGEQDENVLPSLTSRKTRLKTCTFHSVHSGQSS